VHEAEALRVQPAQPVDLQPGTYVEIKGLQANAQWNGQRGWLDTFDASRGAWNVRLADENVVALRPGKFFVVEAPNNEAGQQPLRQQDQAPNNEAGRQPLRQQEQLAAAPPPPPVAPRQSEAVQRNESDSQEIDVLQSALTLTEAAPPEPQVEPLRRGDVVQLVDLKDHPLLNGVEGMLEEWYAEKGCWTVRLRDGRRSALKEKNLERIAIASAHEPNNGFEQQAVIPQDSAPPPPPPPASVPPPPATSAGAADPSALAPGGFAILQNLKTAEHLNGSQVRVVNYLPDKGCWHVQIDDEFHAVRTENLEACGQVQPNGGFSSLPLPGSTEVHQ